MDKLPLIIAFLKLITPDPAMKGVKLKRRQIRLQKKDLRLAERMYRHIKKAYKKDGLTEEEKAELKTLYAMVLQRKKDFITP